MLSHELAHLLDRNLKYVRIRKAQLGAVPKTLAVDKREILRMFVVILVRRNETDGGMAAPEARTASVLVSDLTLTAQIAAVALVVPDSITCVPSSVLPF